MELHFTPPATRATDSIHHAQAAAGNAATAAMASGVLLDALAGTSPVTRLLLKAAAGAGKSYVLRRLVTDAVENSRCERVAVVAFQNRQLWPLASALGTSLGRDKVCLFTAKDRLADVPNDVLAVATIVTTTPDIPYDCDVVISTAHKLGAIGEQRRLLDNLGVGANGETVFDAMFVDEAWQLPHHLFDKIVKAAPIVVGVGDVGQLPPLEIGGNPWRGDPGFNPYRAWPTEDVEDPATLWEAELPAVWRPTAEQLPLWRAFYPEWGELHCVAAPGDRLLATKAMTGVAAEVWAQMGSGVPTMLEVEGLDDADAADVDLPLLAVVEFLLDELFAAGAAFVERRYDDAGSPTEEVCRAAPGVPGDPLVVVLATRNQAVDDAHEMCERLREKHGLTENDLQASTVDSWQGQTNRLTVAIHPLTGADELDEFNSAFGRLAVTCTRATHGLLMMSRPGLDRLLAEAPVRPGTPFGEPGNRHLPRQTHQRILATFTRGTLTIDSTDDEE